VAQPKQRNIVERLADAGEEAIQRFGSAPGADRVLGALNSLRDRVDEMQKRLRGLDALEQRLTALEKRVDKLDGSGRKTTSSSSATTKRKSSSSSSS
jgi:uncharacterized protein involved in exopolysaccharide biosynthesis